MSEHTYGFRLPPEIETVEVVQVSTDLLESKAACDRQRLQNQGEEAMSDDQPLPCPRCQKLPELRQRSVPPFTLYGYICRTTGCAMIGQYASKNEEAIEGWNRLIGLVEKKTAELAEKESSL